MDACARRHRTGWFEYVHNVSLPFDFERRAAFTRLMIACAYYTQRPRRLRTRTIGEAATHVFPTGKTDFSVDVSVPTTLFITTHVRFTSTVRRRNVFRANASETMCSEYR